MNFMEKDQKRVHFEFIHKIFTFVNLRTAVLLMAVKFLLISCIGHCRYAENVKMSVKMQSFLV